MLVLTRKRGEQIRLGNDILITILEVRDGKVRIGIDAPREMPVLREKLCRNQQPPAQEGPA